MVHLSKEDYLSNYFHGTYHKYLLTLTNAFAFRQNVCAEKITSSVKHGDIRSTPSAKEIIERGVLRTWLLS